MCKLSDKLSLCSCEADIDYDKNHWVLNRFRADKNIISVGIPVWPTFIDSEIENHNTVLLTGMLNDGSCFDFELEFQEKDQLVLYLIAKNLFLFYAFEFSDKKWHHFIPKPMSLEWYHDTVREGIIKNAFNSL